MSHCGRIYFIVNESTLNFCNLLFSSFKKWHFKLEINRGNSLNFNDNTMSVQNEHIARQARFLIKSLTTEIMWPSYKSRSIFCPLFWWPETQLIRREIRYLLFHNNYPMGYMRYIPVTPHPPTHTHSNTHASIHTCRLTFDKLVGVHWESKTSHLLQWHC